MSGSEKCFSRARPTPAARRDERARSAQFILYLPVVSSVSNVAETSFSDLRRTSAVRRHRRFSRKKRTSGRASMLATEASATGAAFVADALAPDVMAHLERDVASFIEAFDAGYEPPSSPGSLTSGTPRRVGAHARSSSANLASRVFSVTFALTFSHDPHARRDVLDAHARHARRRSLPQRR